MTVESKSLFPCRGGAVLLDNRTHVITQILELQPVAKAFTISHHGFYRDLHRGIREAHIQEHARADRNRTRNVSAHATVAQVVASPECRLPVPALGKFDSQSDVDPVARPASRLFSGPRLVHQCKPLFAFALPEVIRR